MYTAVLPHIVRVDVPEPKTVIVPHGIQEL